MPTHSVAWAVGAADQSSVAGWALQSSAITNTTTLRAPQLLPPTTPPTPSHRHLSQLTCGELLDGHRRDLHSLRPICNLRLRRSSEFRCWGRPFSLEFLLCHCFLSSRLLLLFNLQWESPAWVSQEHTPEHNPYYHTPDSSTNWQYNEPTTTSECEVQLLYWQKPSLRAGTQDHGMGTQAEHLRQTLPAMRLLPPQDPCRSTGQASLPTGAPGRWCHAYAGPPEPASTTSGPPSGLPAREQSR